jgi:hypothetical protein
MVVDAWTLLPFSACSLLEYKMKLISVVLHLWVNHVQVAVRAPVLCSLTTA